MSHRLYEPMLWAAAAAFIVITWVAPPSGQSASSRSVTQGRGQAEIASVFSCRSGQNVRPSPIGTVKATDGETWTMPAANAFRTGPKAGDLYNECTGARPATLADAPLPPVTVVDADGEVITGYLMADTAP